MEKNFGCATCPAYHPTEEKDRGNCHGDVPIAFLMVGTDLMGKPQPRVQSAWRPVHGITDWCARHPRFSWDEIEPVDVRLEAPSEGEA